MRLQTLFTIGLLILTTACGDTATDAAEEVTTIGEESQEALTPAEVEAEGEAYKAMVDAHDRVMPRMGEIAQAQIQLRDLMNNEDTTDRFREKAKTLNDGLESIHDGMMEWMPAAMVIPDDLRKSKNHEEILAHYAAYDEEMEDMETKLNTYLHSAEELAGMVAAAAEQ
ncbi:MAG: hypothetical protein AAF741_04460 [Bacteroidota bacterium]